MLYTYFLKNRSAGVILTLCLVALSLNSCSSKSHNMDLQKGDLLFCSYEKSGLSSAIDAVTQTKKATHFSHIGLVSIENKDTLVYHASSKKGVVKELISDFIRNENATKMDVYRLKPELITSIDSIITEAKNLVGLPYNFSYILSDSTYYCSQFIYQLFKKQRIFQLEPMTFKDPKTGMFNKMWIEYYDQLNVIIPEGEPGCNPNGLAASNNIIKIKTLQ